MARALRSVVSTSSIAVLLVLVLPAIHASAGTVSVQGGNPYFRVIYSAPLGEHNDLTVTGSADTTNTFHDTAGVTAGSGCTQVDADTATCPADYTEVHLRDLSDIVHLEGTAGAALYGEGGDDQLYGGSAGVRLDGGPGADIMKTGSGGGYVWYGDRGAPVNVTLDGIANDGEAGEGDNVIANVVYGGGGDDTFVGNSSSNKFDGRWGNDTMRGRGGNDDLIGGPDADVEYGGTGNDILSVKDGLSTGGDDHFFGQGGDDSITGDVGNDVLAGGAGNDTIDGVEGSDTERGGPGVDSLRGGNGDDQLSGGADDDTLNSADNGQPDSDVCGTGTDTVTPDASDSVAADCENVTP